MILFSRFGFALRHKVDFDPKTKKGSLVLWSRYEGLFVPPELNSSLSEASMLFLGKSRADYHANFPIGGINDLLAILAAIAWTKSGKEFSFSNYEDRKISFQPTKEGEEQQECVIVKIRYSTNIGKLVAYEITELETVVRNILLDLGLTTQQISEKLDNVVGESSNQSG